VPEAADTTRATEPQRGSVRLHVTYFTDPLCCWSWGFEPQLRRLRHGYAGHIAWRIRMGGMIPTWTSFDDPLNSVHRPGQMGPLWLMASRQTGMPMEVAIWNADPPHSSWPACLAVKAAEMQSPAASDLMLRALREAVMVEGRNIADDSVLLHEAAGLAERFPDLFSCERFEADFAGPEARRLLEDDVKEARYRDIGRFPALLLRRPGGPARLLVGWRPYSDLLDEVTAYAPDLGPERRPASREAYRAYWHSITDREADAAMEPAATAPEPIP
jgi:putative protein-disulfide isomerase